MCDYCIAHSGVATNTANSAKKITYADLIHRRIATKLQKARGEVGIDFSYDGAMVIYADANTDKRIVDILVEFGSFEDFLEWLDVND